MFSKTSGYQFFEEGNINGWINCRFLIKLLQCTKFTEVASMDILSLVSMPFQRIPVCGELVYFDLFCLFLMFIPEVHATFEGMSVFFSSSIMNHTD